jgi:hypothetical protein
MKLRIIRFWLMMVSESRTIADFGMRNKVRNHFHKIRRIYVDR